MEITSTCFSQIAPDTETDAACHVSVAACISFKSFPSNEVNGMRCHLDVKNGLFFYRTAQQACLCIRSDRFIGQS